MSGNEEPMPRPGPDPEISPRPAAPPMPSGARAAGLGDVVDAIIRLYRRRARLLLGICAAFEVPLFALGALLGARLVGAMTGLLGFSPLDPPLTLPDSFPPLDAALVADLLASFVALIVVGMVAGALTTATLALAVAEVGSGRSPTVLGTLGRFVRRLPALLLSQVLYLCAIGAVLFGGTLLVSVPIGLAPDPASGGILVFLGIVAFVGVLAVTTFLSLRLGFWPQIVALEDRAGVAALRRSWRLVAGSTWRVLGYAVLLGLADYTLALVLSQLGGMALDLAGPASAAAVALRLAWNVAVTIIVAPIVPVGMTLLFFELRRGHGEAPPG
jgi:hypothetical protein